MPRGALEFIEELRRRKGLNTVAAIGDAVYYIAGCIQDLKADIARIEGRLDGHDRILHVDRGRSNGNGGQSSAIIKLMSRTLLVCVMAISIVGIALALSLPNGADLLLKIMARLGGGS